MDDAGDDGKFGGSFIAARLNGMKSRHAAALDVPMNPRGLAELIVLNVGLQLRVITPRVFAKLVVMSLVTTPRSPGCFTYQ